MPAETDPSTDLIDPEAPLGGGEEVDTLAYAASPGGEPPPALDGGPPEVEAEPPPAASPGPVDAAVDALLRLARDRPWGEVSLRDIARDASVSFAEIYAKAPGKHALLGRLSDRYDREALQAADADDAPQVKDRLFEAFMARLEAMQRDRDVLIAIGRAEGLALAPRLPRTVRALAEAAGVDTGGPRGALRLAVLTSVWARTLQVWRDDEGALNRTMAEIDKLLTRAERRLKRVGAGF